MSSGTKCWACRKTYSNGYTLIEVLVALLIFSSMVMLATMALDQGLRQYHGLMEKGINFWDNAKHLWINRSFSSVTDYYVKNDDMRWYPYFRGGQEVISYVSLAPLAGDLPVVVWIVNERLNNGRRSLVYYELPVYTKTLKDMERDYFFGGYKKGSSIKLLEDVENVEIKFFGYDFNTRQDIWSGDFEGYKRKALPYLVKVTYAGAGKKNVLVFGLNTNSRRKMAYDDLF